MISTIPDKSIQGKDEILKIKKKRKEVNLKNLNPEEKTKALKKEKEEDCLAIELKRIMINLFQILMIALSVV